MARKSAGVFKLGDGTWAYRYLNLPGRSPRRPQVGGFGSQADASAARRAALDRLARIKRGDEVEIEDVTLAVLVERYLVAHAANVRPSTIEKLRWLLSKAVVEWGNRRPDEIRSHEIDDWRARIAEGHRFEATQALRQTLAWAVERDLAKTNPAKRVRNPTPTAKRVDPFETWDEVEAVAEEIGDHYGPAVIFAAATGLRPAEWIGLEWRNVNREHRVAYVEQAVVEGEKTRTKTRNSLRAVPLTDHALAALDAVRRRDLSTRYVFTTKTGLPIDLHVWRHRHWNPAVEAAGLHADQDGTRRRRPPYALRHTFATLALRQGLSTFEVARYMGTSVQMIDQHYGNLARDSMDHALAKLNSIAGATPTRRKLQAVS